MEINPRSPNNVKRPRYTHDLSSDLSSDNPARYAGSSGSKAGSSTLSSYERNQDVDIFASRYPKSVWSEPQEGASFVNRGDLSRVNDAESGSLSSVNPFVAPDLASEPNEDAVLASFLEFLDDPKVLEEGLPKERNVDSPVSVAEIVTGNAAVASPPTHPPVSVDLTPHASLAKQQPKSRYQKQYETWAKNLGLFTPEGKPDVVAVSRYHKERLAKSLGFQTPDGKPDVAAWRLCYKEKQAKKLGLLTPDGKPDVTTLNRQIKEKQAKKLGLLTPDGKPDVTALYQYHMEKVVSEAKQIGMKVKVYQRFLKDESQKWNFPPRSPVLRKYIQSILKQANAQGIPAGKDTEQFVKVQLANWKLAAGAAASRSSAAQPATLPANIWENDDFYRGEYIGSEDSSSCG